jgi:hypothetical protein
MVWLVLLQYINSGMTNDFEMMKKQEVGHFIFRMEITLRGR